MLMICDKDGKFFPTDAIVLGEKLRFTEDDPGRVLIRVSGEEAEKTITVTVDKQVTRTVTREESVTKWDGERTIEKEFSKETVDDNWVIKYVGTMTVESVIPNTKTYIVTVEKYV